MEDMRCHLSDRLVLLTQARICPPNLESSWRQLSARTSTVLVKGLISTTPVAHKACQFIGIANQWVSPQDGTELYDAVNDAFSTSTFGSSNEDQAGGFAKRTERHPMFVLNISKSGNASGEGCLPQHRQQLAVLLVRVTRRWLTDAGFTSGGGSRVRSKLTPVSKSPVATFGIDESAMEAPEPYSASGGNMGFAPPDKSRIRCGTPRQPMRGKRSLTKTPPADSGRASRLLGGSDSGVAAGSLEVSSVSKLGREPEFLDHAQLYTSGPHASIPIFHHHCDKLGRGGPSDLFARPGVFAEVGSCDPAQIVLDNAIVIRQVDTKFILCKTAAADTHHEALFIIDQHAASERVILESLLGELCRSRDEESRITNSLKKEGIRATTLLDPITFEVNDHEYERFQRSQAEFAYWGICYETRNKPQIDNKPRSFSIIVVEALPEVITAQCMASHKVLIDLMKAEVWNLTMPATTRSLTKPSVTPTWLSKLSRCPQKMLDLINSRACRSAIMFNDVLTISQCQDLMEQLAGTVFPKMCAHGRTSVVPLFRLGEDGLRLRPAAPVFMGSNEKEGPRTNYAAAYTAWRHARV